MNEEQKHKEDLEAAKGWLEITKKDNNTMTIQILVNFFPMIKESENEKNKQNFWEKCNRCEYFDGYDICLHKKNFGSVTDELKENCKNSDFFLEKQGEQKHAEWHREDEQNLNACLGYIPDEYLRRWLKDVIHAKYDKPAWSEEDKKMFSGLISIVEDWYNSMSEKEKEYYGDCGYINWLNSIKERVQSQPKQEWSYEDVKNLNSIKWIIENSENLNRVFETINSPEYIKKYFIDFLNSIKPNHWKPSEQNIKDLEWCADLVKDKMEVGFHRLQVFIDELKNL